MSDVLSPILQWINAHPEFSGLATFTISAAESIAIIGTIVPGTVMMTAIGTLAGMGVIPLWHTIFWAILGAIVGDGISYWAGRYFNTRLRSIWPFRTHPSLLQSGEYFFRKHGWMSVFIGRFVGPVRALVPLVAGMMNMPPWRFTIANVLSAIGWAPAYMLPGIILGAASLELPPDIAVHVILMLLATALLIMFGIWLVQKTFRLISKRIDYFLTWVWNKLYDSSYFHAITRILQHSNPKKTYGQLTLAFYFLFTCWLLFYLFLYIYVSGPSDILVNNAALHFFRSIRTPTTDNIMLSITFLGEKQVLLPLMVTLFAWFAYTKRWWTAWHVLALGVLAAAGVQIIKWLARSPRPWGLMQSPEHFSFPSGHTTLTVVFYLGIAFLLIKAFELKSRRFLYYCTALIILAVSLSRLYLGVHWVTDILGGWLLGAAIFMLVALSYNRHAEKELRPTGIILTIVLTLALSYSVAMYRHFDRFRTDYQPMSWPVNSITQTDWWLQRGMNLPRLRVNRFGLETQAFNLQWIGNLNDIQKTLLANGWQVPPKNDLVSVLHRLSNVESMEHLPLVSPLHFDKRPVLIMVKHISGDKKLIVLRLWMPNTTLRDTKAPLWVGSVEHAPSTYSWLFNNKHNQIKLTPGLLFAVPPKNYEIKKMMLHLDYPHRSSDEPIMLIKPKG